MGDTVMKRYRSGTWAPRGYYLCRDSWEIRALPRIGGILKGAQESIYIRLPIHPILMPFLGAFLGGLFVVLVPFVAIPILLWLLGTKAWKRLLAIMAHLEERRRGA
ncbi:MAG: hypothetical protein HYY45_13355 [Deltaproteobacteria bacterium]|nr:hypothetical protein [Deltaproteobacteria bacterium]